MWFLGQLSVSKGATAANAQAGAPFRNTSDIDYGVWLATQRVHLSQRAGDGKVAIYCHLLISGEICVFQSNQG
jgi:hypothetical protein